DLSHPGMERLNVTKRLMKTKVKPELPGYTLLHAVRHPKIIQEQSHFKPLMDPNYLLPNRFTHSESELISDRKLHLAVLKAFVVETGCLPNIQAVSKLTDLDLKSVVERGEQKRIYQAIMRDFHSNHLFLDEVALARNSLRVTRGVADSSFPDPVW